MKKILLSLTLSIASLGFTTNAGANVPQLLAACLEDAYCEIVDIPDTHYLMVAFPASLEIPLRDACETLIADEVTLDTWQGIFSVEASLDRSGTGDSYLFAQCFHQKADGGSGEFDDNGFEIYGDDI